LGALCCAAAAAATYHLARQPQRRVHGSVILNEKGLWRADEAGSKNLASWSSPFGVMVLRSGHDRSLALAFSSANSVRYVALDTVGEAPSELLAMAHTLAGGGAPPWGRARHGALAPVDALDVVQAIRNRAPDALRRVVLSSQAGDVIHWNREVLRVGERAILLSAPLQWRSFRFAERLGNRYVLFRGCTVCQGDTTFTLVAPWPAESEGSTAPTTLASDAVPRGHRIAIDSLFLDPLQEILARSPVAYASIPPTDQGRGKERRA
jgi:hypothetical protein